MDLRSLVDPKLTSSPSCQESKCGPDIHSSPSHRVGQQLFSVAPPNPSPRDRGGNVPLSSAPSPLGLLGGGSSLILSFLAPGAHLGSSPRQPPGFSLQSNLWHSADKLSPDPQEVRHLGSVSFYTNGPMSLDFAQSWIQGSGLSVPSLVPQSLGGALCWPLGSARKHRVGQMHSLRGSGEGDKSQRNK